jgi:predicted porin
MMRSFGSIVLRSAAGLVLVSGAQAADLPTKKAPPPPPAKVSCFASFYDYVSASAKECPLTYMGITVYGQLDAGGGWSSHASRFNSSYNNGVFSVVSKTSQGPAFQLVPNGLSQSNVGIKGKEEFLPGWSFVFDVNTGFDPYSLRLANGPRSLVENNDRNLIDQNTNSDSSRAGQWDNTRAYAGISNTVLGTLTAGRQYALSTDLVNSYDPMGGSYAFSLIGFSSTLGAGLGDTEVARYNTSLKYQVTYNNLRAAAAWQFGGYELGNGSNGAFQVGVGGDYAGFSADAIYSHAKDAVSLGTYGSNPLPAGVIQTDLKATLANIDAGIVGLKYVTGPFKLFGGYEYDRYKPPSDTYPDGFGTLGGYTVLPGAVSVTNYINNKILQVAWFGATYSIRPDLDITGAYYYAFQNNFLPATGVPSCGPNTTVSAATGGNLLQGAANSYCAGHEHAVSGLLDWRPLKRLDVYAGVMFSQVNGGLASGFFHTNNVAPTVGLRLSF